jgi:hypothetical protein
VKLEGTGGSTLLVDLNTDVGLEVGRRENVIPIIRPIIQDLQIVRAAGVIPSGSWTRAAGSLVKIVVASNVATATTLAAHGLAAGNRIRVTGASVDFSLTSVYRVDSTPTATTFTFATTTLYPVADGTYTEATLGIYRNVVGLLMQTYSYATLRNVRVSRHETGVMLTDTHSSLSLGLYAYNLRVSNCSRAYLHYGRATQSNFYGTELGENGGESLAPTYGIEFGYLGEEARFYGLDVIPRHADGPTNTCAFGWDKANQTTGANGLFKFFYPNTENIRTTFCSDASTARINDIHITQGRLTNQLAFWEFNAATELLHFIATDVSVYNPFSKTLLVADRIKFSGCFLAGPLTTLTGNSLGGLILTGNRLYSQIALLGNFANLTVTSNEFEAGLLNLNGLTTCDTCYHQIGFNSGLTGSSPVLFGGFPPESSLVQYDTNGGVPYSAAVNLGRSPASGIALGLHGASVGNVVLESFNIKNDATPSKSIAGVLAGIVVTSVTAGAESAEYIIGTKPAGGLATERFRIHDDGTVELTAGLVAAGPASIAPGGTVVVRAAGLSLTAQNAAITTANLLAAAPAGTYRVSAYLQTTTLSAGACTSALTIGWTYNASAKTGTPITGHSHAVDETFSQGTYTIRSQAAANITYAVDLTGGANCNNAVYDLYTSLESLQ